VHFRARAYFVDGFYMYGCAILSDNVLIDHVSLALVAFCCIAIF